MTVTSPMLNFYGRIQAVDPDLANSLTKLQTYVETRRALESNSSVVWTVFIVKCDEGLRRHGLVSTCQEAICNSPIQCSVEH